MKNLILIVLFSLSCFILIGRPPSKDYFDKLIQKEGLTRAVTSINSLMLAMENKGWDKPSYSVQSSGTSVKIPVILFQFSDMTFDTTHDKTFYNTLLNTGEFSAKKYFRDMSNNKLNLDFVVCGPYTAPNRHDYYGKDGATEDDTDINVSEFVNSAIKDMSNDSTDMDFSQFDNDNDGVIDVFVIIYPGTEQTSKDGVANDIWPHQYTISDTTSIIKDGKKGETYCIQGEKPGTIGTLCHEFGHVLGLPDLYDTSYETNGVGVWSIMAGGADLGTPAGSRPAPLLAWERDYLKWVTIEEIQLSTTTTTVSESPNKNTNYAGFGILFSIILIGSLITFIFRKDRKIFINMIILVAISSLSTGIFMSCEGQVNSTTTTSTTDNSNTTTTSFAGTTTTTGTTTTLMSQPLNLSIKDIESSYIAKKVVLREYTDSSQYYLIENKLRKANTWTEFLPGDGLLITHIDTKYTSGEYLNDNNICYSNSRIHGVNVVEADNTTGNPLKGKLWSDPNYYGDVANLFKASGTNKITPDSSPNSNYYSSGSKRWKSSGVYIENISASGETMTFTTRN